jgi:hypothetical protein
MSNAQSKTDHAKPRVSVETCARCRKKFERGNRVTYCLIFDRAGRDPKNIAAMGVHLIHEYELIHIDCRDPFLVKGIV